MTANAARLTNFMVASSKTKLTMLMKKDGKAGERIKC